MEKSILQTESKLTKSDKAKGLSRVKKTESGTSNKAISKGQRVMKKKPSWTSAIAADIEKQQTQEILAVEQQGADAAFKPKRASKLKVNNGT